MRCHWRSADDWTCYQEPALDFSLCVQQCEVASDCAPASATGAFVADNFQCNDNACEYMGCSDDDECTESLSRDGRCVPGFGGKSFCVAACTAAADCALANPTAAYDEDNYACTDGACEYSGCNSDEECQALAPNYFCH